MLMIHENSVMSTEVQRSGDISRHRERNKVKRGDPECNSEKGDVEY